MASDPAKGDDLGRTATAVPGTSAHAPPAEPLAGSLGRYRLERELGEGGMGVVHAAYDPDLQRRIALKVLRIAASSVEAKDRLLREARAMARLAHPNVVTVHEVGTANGRDYVAMELILGETLAEWLRAEDQRKVDIVAAFLAAGRGLAAAHAAGIVHRDFKPHNVLRSRAGRIVVTDFGLAREAQAALPAAAFESSASPGGGGTPAAARPVMFPDSTPSTLSGITATGSLLGTPAYMAPEQWGGGAVTPATDQFAFCVAFWEALAGERPFPGPTLEDLRAQAKAGPSARAAAKIPRRLRPILLRGLDPDPAMRWPNMDALLAQIVRAERRPVIMIALGVTALIIAIVIAVGIRARDELAVHPRCPPAALDPGKVWPGRGGVGTQRIAAGLLDSEIASWSTVRDAACKLEQGERAPRLWCLDGVLTRIDAVAQAARANRNGAQIDAGAALIDPQVCELARAPRLVPATPELRQAVAAWMAHSAEPSHQDAAAATALVARTAADPCASALAHLLVADNLKGSAERTLHIDEAQQDAERCGDDRVLAEAAIAAAQRVLDSEWLSPTVTAKLRLADAAAHRVEQRDLLAQIDLMRVEVAKRGENLDEAIARAGSAVAGFAARGRLRAQIAAGLTVLSLRQLRATPADLSMISDRLAAWRKRAVDELGEGDDAVRAIDAHAAEWAFDRGDVLAAHALLARPGRPNGSDKLRTIAGEVVDERGTPVVGAKVTAGRSLRGDSIGAATAFMERDTIRIATTGPDGQFSIPDAVDDSVVVAELGERRSSPESIVPPMIAAPASPPPPIKLVIAPTSRIEGKVELAGEPPTNVAIVVKDHARPMMIRYATVAPVAADGSFVLDGVPRHEVRVFAAIEGLSEKVMGGTTVVVRAPVVKGLALSLATSSRVIHVLVRSTVSTRLPNAEVIVFPGRVPSMNALEMNNQFRGGTIRWARQIDGEHAPKEILPLAQAGDLFATMPDMPEGTATACALGITELSDEALERKIHAHLDKLQVICAPVPPVTSGTNVVVIQVPPFPRLD